MEPINRSLLKTHAKQALSHSFWLTLLVCLVASLLGANWTGLSSGSNGFSSYISFTNSYMRTTYRLKNHKNHDGSANYYSSANDTKEALDSITQAIQDTEKGQDFYYFYDDYMSEADNIKQYINDILDYFHITNEDILSVVLICSGIFLLIGVMVWFVSAAFSFVIGSFLCAPISVGYRNYFMKNRLKKQSFGDLFSAFSSGKYMPTVKAMFAKNIRVWAWSLLFYFPGVVKHYEYYFVAYIMAENPTISPERARELSREMSYGHKWQIFVLELSFLGWAMLFVVEEIFLAIISCGLLAIPGMLLIYPLVAYECATFAELYEERREYMLVSAITNETELIGF